MRETLTGMVTEVSEPQPRNRSSETTFMLLGMTAVCRPNCRTRHTQYW